MLRGMKLRITYKRPPRKENKGDKTRLMHDINSEASRLKRFKNFGKTVTTKRFFDERQANYSGQTVIDYFENSEYQNMSIEIRH